MIGGVVAPGEVSVKESAAQSPTADPTVAELPPAVVNAEVTGPAMSNVCQKQTLEQGVTPLNRVSLTSKSSLILQMSEEHLQIV